MKSSSKVIKWTEKMRVNFDVLCNCLCDVCCLHIPVSSDLFVLQTDAFCRGVCSVLSVLRYDTELPVGLYPRQLKDSETQYSVSGLEMSGCCGLYKAF